MTEKEKAKARLVDAILQDRRLILWRKRNSRALIGRHQIYADDMIICRWEGYYRPDNMRVVQWDDYKPEQAIKLIEKYIP